MMDKNVDIEDCEGDKCNHNGLMASLVGEYI